MHIYTLAGMHDYHVLTLQCKTVFPCVCMNECSYIHMGKQFDIAMSTLFARHRKGEYLYSTVHIWLKSTKSGPLGFEKMDFSHFSPCSMQWMFQTPGVSIVHVQKTVSYNNL